MLYLQSDHPLQADIVSKPGVRKFRHGKSIVLSTKLVGGPACWRHLCDSRRVVAVYCTSVSCNPLTPLLRFVVDLWYKLHRHLCIRFWLTTRGSSAVADLLLIPTIMSWYYLLTLPNCWSLQWSCRSKRSYRPGGGETICPPPMPVRLMADLRPSADGSAVRIWLRA